MTKASLVCVPLLAILCLSCGSGGSSNGASSGSSNGGSISCTTASNGSNISCQEILDATTSDITELQASCNVGDAGGGFSATYSASGCSHTGAVGGCQVTEKTVTAVTWFYGAGSAASVQSACNGTGGKFVAP